MNKADIMKFLDPFKAETDIFILIGGNRIPIKTLTYEIPDDSTGKVLIEPEYVAKSDLVGEGDERFFLWTDGACSGNPGPGGWAYFLSTFSVVDGKYDSMRSHKSTGYLDGSTTNNAMELEAVIQGLGAAYSMSGKRGDRHIITITSDSEYVVNGITGVFVIKTNLHLWENLKAILADMKEWEIQWVRSSPSNACHRWCDLAAKAASKNKGDIGELAKAVAHAPSLDEL